MSSLESAAPLAPPATLSSVLRQRPFFWFTAGQTLSFFGDKLHAMALIGLTGTMQPESTPLVLAGLALLYCVPFLIVAPIAGAMVDRWNRKRTLIACDAARAVVVALLPMAYARTGSVVLLFVFVAAVVVTTLFFNVAKMAIVPDLVAARDLVSANAVSSLLSRTASLAGIVFGGLIVGWPIWTSLGWPGYAAGFYLDAGTFVVSVATLLLMKPVSVRPTLSTADRASRHGERQPEARGRILPWWSRAGDVARMARADPTVLFALAASGLLGIVAGSMYVVLVLTLQTRTAWGTPGVGFVLGILAGGIIAGTAAVRALAQRWRKPDIVAACLGVAGILLIGFALPFAFVVHGPLSFAAGMALGPLTVTLDTILHERVPDHVRARVFSGRDVVLNVAFGLSAAATGAVVTVLRHIGLKNPFPVVVVTLSAVVVLLSAVGARFARRLDR
ncbi:MAG: MFS transporter [Acidobacteriota bacterium]